MTYKRNHVDCTYKDCELHRAYVRVKNKWIPIGDFGIQCQKFESFRYIQLLLSFN